MPAEKHRVERLRLWLTEFDGKISAFCRMYGLPRTRASYLSQILSGNRPLGERAARKLEAECNRPAGWLDMEASEPQKLKYDVARFSQLSTQDKELIEGFVEFVLQRSELRTMSKAKSAPISSEMEFTPKPKQIEAIKNADRKPRQPIETHHIPIKKQRRAA